MLYSHEYRWLSEDDDSRLTTSQELIIQCAKVIQENNYKTYIDQMAKLEEKLHVKYTFKGSENAVYPFIYMSTNGKYFEYNSEMYKQLFVIDEIQYNLEQNKVTNDKNAENSLIEQLNIELYRLEHNIVTENYKECIYTQASNMYGNVWKNMINSVEYMYILSMVAILLAGGIVANEYTSKTVKFYMLSPNRKSKLLFSKFLALISMIIIFVIVYFVVNMIYSVVLSGTNGLTNTYYTRIVEGSVKCDNVIKYIARDYLYGMIKIIMLAVIAFSIATVTRQASVGVIIAIVTLLASDIINNTLIGDGFYYRRYLIFANIDLKTVISGSDSAVFVNQTIPAALVILLIHFIVLYLIANDAFVRKDL